MENYMEYLKEGRTMLIQYYNNTMSIKDLSSCHRQKVFSVIDPIRINENELFNYVIKKGMHDAIEQLFRLFPLRFECEKEIRYKNIRGRIDIYDQLESIVIDVKTTDAYTELLKPYKFHIKQVLYYMSIVGANEGCIIYLLAKKGKFQYFTLTLKEKERILNLKTMEKETADIQKSISLQDPSIVNGVSEDNELKWMCNKCPYNETCRKLNNSNTK